jgi:hypothetical protein
MADIFLSYAREDATRARRVAQALESRGWSVWWDRRIPHGQDFTAHIQLQLDAATCIVVLWSAAAVKSSFVRDEANEGLNGRLVPLLLEPVKQPLGFRQYQSADLTDWTGKGTHEEFERAALRNSMFLVAVITPGYLRSKGALRELSEFETVAERQGGLTLHATSRLIKVMKTPVPFSDLPPLLQQRLGYEFYKVDPQTGKARPFDNPFDFAPDLRHDFWLRLDDLVGGMARVLTQGASA